MIARPVFEAWAHAFPSLPLAIFHRASIKAQWDVEAPHRQHSQWRPSLGEAPLHSHHFSHVV